MSPPTQYRLYMTFAEVPAGYLLWCRCTAELRVLNDEYTCQLALTDVRLH